LRYAAMLTIIIGMKNDEFDKLFKYMAKRFDVLEKKVDNCADKESLALQNSADLLIKDCKDLTDLKFTSIL
jgi:hypothetical protein